MNINQQLKNNEARRLVIERLVLTILNGCGLKSSPVIDVPWEIHVEPLRNWSIRNLIRVRMKYQPESKFFSIDRNATENTSAVLWIEVFSDSIWLARTGDVRNFINAITPIKSVQSGEYYNKQEIMSIFHRIDKMKVIEVRNKIKELCSIRY